MKAHSPIQTITRSHRVFVNTVIRKRTLGNYYSQR